MSQSNQFRIGGIYRNERGQVVELSETPALGDWKNEPGQAFANTINAAREIETGAGVVDLVDGRSHYALGFSLIPGELRFAQGQWISVDEMTLDELTADLLDPNAAMIARDASSPDLAGEWKPFEFGSAHLKG